MMHSKTRLPKLLSPRKIIYEAGLLFRLRLFSLFALFLFIFVCGGFVFGLNRLQHTYRTSMTSAAISMSTANMALTQTAMPTNTPTFTPTVTQTPTITPSPTITPTLTSTPVYAWIRSLPDNSRETGPAFSMDIDSNDNIWLAYFLDSTDDIKLSKFTRGVWRSFGNLSQLNKEGRSVGIHVNLQLPTPDRPHLTYLIYDKSRIRYSYLISDGTWSTQDLDRNVDLVDLKFVMDSNENRYFVLLTGSGDILFYSKDVKKEKIDSGIVFPAHFSAPRGDANPVAMTVSNKGLVFICYSKMGRIRCSRGTSRQWNTLDIDNGLFPSIKFDSAGNLYLTYYDPDKKALKFAFLPANSSTPQIWIVDQSGDVGLYPSIAIDKVGVVHISYYDLTNSSLKYAVGRDNGWSIFSLDDEGDVGVISSLCVDSAGNPYIAYYSQSAQQIQFVYGKRR